MKLASILGLRGPLTLRNWIELALLIGMTAIAILILGMRR
jgi:hypothetical protein